MLDLPVSVHRASADQLVVYQIIGAQYKIDTNQTKMHIYAGAVKRPASPLSPARRQRASWPAWRLPQQNHWWCYSHLYLFRQISDLKV